METRLLSGSSVEEQIEQDGHSDYRREQYHPGESSGISLLFMRLGFRCDLRFLLPVGVQGICSLFFPGCLQAGTFVPIFLPGETALGLFFLGYGHLGQQRSLSPERINRFVGVV